MLFAAMISCSPKVEWQNVSYNQSHNNSHGTACITNHQGEHELNKCNVYMDGDTLIILFPTELPAYWGSMEVQIINGKFKAQFDGIPFGPMMDLKFETIKQKLVLDRSKYLLNDTLYGYCDITFKEIEPATGQTYTFYFKGTIREIIRDKDFNPRDPENFMTFDLPTAIRELGEPLSRKNISTIHEFNIGLLNFFPMDTINNNVQIEELTWNISDDASISDEGIERLTIWYAWAKDKEYARKGQYVHFPPIWDSLSKDSAWQLPVLFLKWNAHWQF